MLQRPVESIPSKNGGITKGSAGFGEWNIDQFVDDDTICLAELADEFASIPFGLFLDEGVVIKTQH